MRYASPSPSHDAPPSPKIRACIICYITSNISQSIAYPITSFFTPQTISTTRISSALPFPSFNAHNGQARTTTLACCPRPFVTTTPSRWAGGNHCARSLPPTLRNHHAIRSEAICHNIHKQLHTRRPLTPHTKKPLAHYRTNHFRKQIYVKKFGHKSHRKKLSATTRKGPGRLSSSNRDPSYKISIEHFR